MKNIAEVILILSFTVLSISCSRDAKKSSKVENRDFKIITYNVWYGFQDGDHPRFPCYSSGETRRDSIYSWLASQDPEVVVFQELIDYSGDRLRKESQHWNHKYAVTLRDKGMAIGISSKYPIEVKEVLTDGMHHGLIYCSVLGVDIIGTHLWPSFDDNILEEAKIVEKRISNSLVEGRSIIVLGDFNAFSSEDDTYIDEETIDLYANRWNWKLENGRPSYRVIQNFLDLGLKDVCTKFAKNGNARRERYDFIFASPELHKECYDAVHFQNREFLKVSDHFPIIAKFKLSR